MGLIGKLLGRK
jgi:hypothetical protein